MKPRDIPDADLRQLQGLLDAALPECYWKRRFNLIWHERGIEQALAEWQRGPIQNPEFAARVEALVADLIRRFDTPRSP